MGPDPVTSLRTSTWMGAMVTRCQLRGFGVPYRKGAAAYRHTTYGTTCELHSGDSYAIPDGIDHSMDVLGGSGRSSTSSHHFAKNTADISPKPLGSYQN
jgi:hypothetical protein